LTVGRTAGGGPTSCSRKPGARPDGDGADVGRDTPPRPEQYEAPSRSALCTPAAVEPRRVGRVMLVRLAMRPQPTEPSVEQQVEHDSGDGDGSACDTPPITRAPRPTDTRLPSRRITRARRPVRDAPGSRPALPALSVSACRVTVPHHLPRGARLQRDRELAGLACPATRPSDGRLRRRYFRTPW
jgi:hypothetical protein